ncbi:prephenate dehydrogenase/arogenate dehydrogenase family protein [Hydrogenovibrio sp. 3SP14C1]|uniref:prephenate dehydrogenase n=1 Tax=Hydrogenovibrio sp. 3SP14C1 TaxID=3038774 RepID=UPI0024166281|nr:prephenate dehydrogenase/arogenate dehydrogenase family protein [Hydrogenovibrio sp. 3SP14C1]MDG4812730.1 prephenate dehydrogenase/arogenate dehydrogenase family protein [Hydrogenovibrio sp. 3SP14C1]
MRLNKITIIGVGLIGGSFAKGIKKAQLCNQITGFGLDEKELQKAINLNVIDDYCLDIASAVKDADLILLSVPLGAMQKVLTDIKPYVTEKTIITDVGSAKTSVLTAVKTVFNKIPTRFVAGHPIAGKEKSGVEAACDALFKAHKVILTPTSETDKHALEQVQHLWQALGADVSEMTPEFHDEVFAATSHLPHLLAFGLVNLLNDHEELGNVFQYTAGGFRDFTRIASSDATMWRDISMSNSDSIVKWLKNYQQELDHLINLVETHESDKIYDFFSQAKKARDTHIQ